jgi:hypothetical protein
MIMKKQKIGLGLEIKYDKVIKKLKKTGISKNKAEELAFHFMEIEYSFDGFLKNIDNILSYRNKKKILNELKDIWNEFEIHVVSSHIIPVKKIIIDLI